MPDPDILAPDLPPRWLDMHPAQQALCLDALSAAAQAAVEGRPLPCYHDGGPADGLCQGRRVVLCPKCSAAEALVLLGVATA